jgi:phage terminase large subunit-like protein
MNLACRDWFERLKAGRAPIADLELDEESSARAVRVFNKLRLPDVPGQPTLAEAAGDWTRDFVRAVFGSVILDDDGKIVGRTIRKFFELVPKKNAKTTKGAGIMLTALLVNQRPNAVFLLIGPTQQTADLAFAQAVGMIAADPENYLQKRFQVQEHKKRILDRTNGASLQIKTFDNRVLTGQKPAGILVDELHELGKFHYAAKVMQQLRGGIIANPEAFIIFITTQSDEPPTGIFKTELEYARDVRDGLIEGGDTLPMLYEFPLTMQADKSEPWKDPRNWPLVLPNLGRSIQLGTLEIEFSEAIEKGAETLSIWASQHLNVQIGIAIHRDRWAGSKYWPLAADASLTFESLLERSEVITVGIDGGGLDDLLGAAFCGRDAKTKEWLFYFRAWAHEDALDQRKENNDRMHQFARDGQLTICSEPTQDIEELVELIGQVHDAGLLPDKHAIGLDPVGVAAITDELAKRGIEPEQMSAIGQGYRLSGTIKGMERKLKDGTLWHDGSPLMTWCVGNAKAELKGSALMITKQVAGKAKIDPLVAGFNAFALMARNPDAAGGALSPWDKDENYRMAF